MNELTETWIVVKRQGGMAENWLYQYVGGKRVFNGKQARDLVKSLGPPWEMLHATGHYEPPDHVGDPTHRDWNRIHPKTGEKLLGQFGDYPGIVK